MPLDSALQPSCAGKICREDEPQHLIRRDPLNTSGQESRFAKGEEDSDVTCPPPMSRKSKAGVSNNF